MKRSITEKINHRISLMMFFALTVLFVSSFLIVSSIIQSRNDKYARAIVSVYGDVILQDSYNHKEPIDLEHNEYANFCGNYICEWMHVDYAYIYSIDTVNNTRTYISDSMKKSLRKPVEAEPGGLMTVHPNTDDLQIGITEERVPTQSELDVWNEKETFGKITTDNEYGHEITTIFLIKDLYGNKYIAAIDTSYADETNQIITSFAWLAVIILAVVVLTMVVVYLVIRKFVSRPAQKISKAFNDYIVDGNRSKEKIEENSSREYSMIASSFNSMTEDIDRYIENINSLNREREREQAELDIASRIQKGFVPKEAFATFDYGIHALMKPARNVGGDLYSYYPIDDHRVLVVIADVSGKGISAAFFMAFILTTMYQFSRMCYEPEKILKMTNDFVSENNAESLFATAFIGIYDSLTGEFAYSNAGHNPPYILGDKVTMLEAKSGTPIGLFGNEEYPRNSVKLNKGDTLLIYTDGVTEAIDMNRKFFGIKNLEKALENFNGDGAKELIPYLLETVEKYSGDAEQYDDITMLALTVNRDKKIELNAGINEFEIIKNEIMKLPLSKIGKLNFCLAAEECFANICSYAFENSDTKDRKITVRIEVSDRIKLTFEDNGMKFNQLEDIRDVDDYDIDCEIGGLGRFIAVSNVDDATYEYKNDKNILTLIKNIEEEEK